MKKMILLLFVACGLSAMADSVPLRTDRKTAACSDGRAQAEVSSGDSDGKASVRGDGAHPLWASGSTGNRSIGSSTKEGEGKSGSKQQQTGREPLRRLYRSGDFNGETGIKELESLLAKGFDPNERGSDGTTLLMFVAKGIARRTVRRSSRGFNETNDLAIAKVLLAHGADPNLRTTFGETALGNVLKQPAYDGQLAFAKLLLDKGADPNAADHLGNTPLMHLFSTKFDETKLELMKLLLERGADVKGGEWRKSVLEQVEDWQVGTQKLDVVRMLVKKGAPVPRRHREWMVHERSRREAMDRIAADRRQMDEAKEEHRLKSCQEYVERCRGEFLFRVPAERRKAFEGWLASRRKEEAAALESARKRARERESEASSRDEKAAAHKAGIADSRSGRFGYDQRSALAHELREYQFWLNGRIREDGRRANGLRLPIRSAHDLRQTVHGDLARQLKENAAKRLQIRDRRHRRPTAFVIAFAVASVFAVVLAVVLSFWRRGRRSERGYGACQHESNVIVNYFRCLAKYVDFSGRSDRSEYWSFTLTNALIAFLIGGSGLNELEIVFAVVMLLPWLAAATRRLHDVGRSGWRLVFFLVPLVVVALLGNMPLREVNELGWNEDLFGIVASFSLGMVLIFGIWNLVLLLRKGVEGEPFNHDRHDYEFDEDKNEFVEMIADSKDEIGMKKVRGRTKLDEDDPRYKL